MFWEPYGTFAIGEFDNIHYDKTVRYRVTIQKKNYSRIVRRQLLFGKDPVIIRTLNDDVFGIKGTEAILNIINKDSTLPLSTFFSEEEDMFKVFVEAIYLDSGNVTQQKTIFTGFLVQEDSSEILSDISHEIRLSFTDNLGTLKNISFGDAAKMSPLSASNIFTFQANINVYQEQATESAYIQILTFPFSGNPVAGDYIILNDTPVGDCVFTIIKVEDGMINRKIYVRERVLPINNVNVNITYIKGSDPFARLQLREIIRICLHGTNLLLDFYFGNQARAILEGSGLLLSMRIDGRTFLSGENNWMSCYDILQAICKRLQCSLFQSDGRWYMVRWNELRYQTNQIIHTIYNGYLSTNEVTVQYPANTLDKVETGMEESIIRPYNYYKETFNYKQNSQLLYNGNLEILGPKLRQNIVTVNSVQFRQDEYESVGFTANPLQTTPHESFIRVVRRDDTGEEVDRYLVVRALGSPVGSLIEYPYLSTGIEVNAGDRLKISVAIKIKNQDNNSISTSIFFAIKSGGTTNYITNSGIANTNPTQYNWTTSAPSGIQREVNENEFLDYTIESAPIPITGLLKLYLNAVYIDPINAPLINDEAYYKNLKVEIINTSATNATIKGQEHKGYVNKVVKNNENQDIIMDFSPKNSIYGTFFSAASINDVRVRNSQVQDGTSLWQGTIGELMTKQMMDWRYIQRVKLEGKLLGIYKTNFEWLTMHQALIFSIKSGKYFIFGKAVYNLKEDFIEATLYEMWKDGEERTTQGIGTNQLLDYEFKYLY